MASIRDVAALAGVSPATVSRVMNGTAKVDAEKKERVMKAIQETGFVPNEAARTLFRKSSQLIGLIVPSVRNPYFTELSAHVDTLAIANGFRAFLCNTGYDPEKEKAAALVREIFNKKVLQYDLDGNFIKTYSSISQMCLKMDFDSKCVRMCLKGKFKQHHGYTFRHHENNCSKQNSNETNKD